jgi:hypothetical protein
MIRKIFSHRATRVLLWISLTLITLVVLLFTWVNWSGKRRWAVTKAMIEREGETLDFRALLPEPPPEAENLLAIEPLRGIAGVVDNDPSKGEPGAKRAALAAMKWQGGTLSFSGVTLGKTTDLQEWVKILRDAKFLQVPPDSSAPAADVLAALDAQFPLLKQLADEAPKRPQAMFTPALKDRELPDMIVTLSMAHYNGAQALARVLTLRARTAIEAKNGTEAARSIIAAHRIAYACRQEPLLIGLLVGISIDSMTLESLWLGLRERVFAEEELRRLQELYAADETEKALLQAMRGELAAGVDALEYLQRAKAEGKGSAAEMLAGLSGGNDDSGLMIARLPNGMLDHWKSVIGEVELRYMIQPTKQGMVAAVSAGEALDREIKDKHNIVLHADWIMARLMVPAVKQVSLSAWLGAAREQQALAAIALERFFVKRGAYPAKLEELVPEFLPVVPLDACDGKPLRYRTTESGRFKLWSVGFDGKDDAGKVTLEANKTPKLNKGEYLGDWAWQYEPVK